MADTLSLLRDASRTFKKVQRKVISEQIKARKKAMGYTGRKNSGNAKRYRKRKESATPPVAGGESPAGYETGSVGA
jgi:hypothetical protein